MPNSIQNQRLGFIDFSRGFVMILMAWDHVSGFWNSGKMGGEGLGGYFPVYTDQLQFLLRFMTHVCAPTFIFLAGTSLAISTWKRQSRGESESNISNRMVVRGIILLLLSQFLVRPSFGIRPFYFGVIACIGVCFIVFSISRKMPSRRYKDTTTLSKLSSPSQILGCTHCFNWNKRCISGYTKIKKGRYPML